MRIVAIGDTHTKHRKLQVPDGDVLLFAGDGEFRSALDLIDFNNWLSELGHEIVIAIAGNHDFFCERFPNEVGKYLPNGMALWASPMTMTFLNWAFMESDENLDRYHWSKIPKETNVLLTHGPALGHLDIGQPQDGHLGSKTLVNRIEKLKIPYVIHGHIHGSYGTKKTKDTTYVNCSVLNEEYNVVNQPIVLDV